MSERAPHGQRPLRSLGEGLHRAYGPERRLRVLCDLLEPMIPRGATLLDVGCGDGALDLWLAERRRDVRIHGIDVLVRQGAQLPIETFDGRRIPYGDDAFDVVLLVDVLHHNEDPEQLLGEAARVARQRILVKDHTLAGPFAASLLRFMDEVGNRRFEIALVYNYWPEVRWREAFDRLRLAVELWDNRLHLYPPPLDWIFGRSLHFVAQLGIGRPTPLLSEDPSR